MRAVERGLELNTLKTHPRARSRLRVYHIHSAPVLVDHIGSAPGRQNRALLPRADPAQMFTGEVEGAVRRIEERVFALLAMTESRGEAEAVRHTLASRAPSSGRDANPRLPCATCRTVRATICLLLLPLVCRSDRLRAKSPSPKRVGRWDTRPVWSVLSSMKFRRICARRLPRTGATAMRS